MSKTNIDEINRNIYDIKNKDEEGMSKMRKLDKKLKQVLVKKKNCSN